LDFNMAKGDATGGIGIGYNPGGPNIGGSATFGSQRMQPQMPMSPIPNIPVGNGPSQMGMNPGSVGPSQPFMGDPGMRTTPGYQPPNTPPINTGYYDRMMQQFNQAGGANNPNLPQGTAFNYRPQPMPNRSQGPMIGPSPDMQTSTVPPISPNSYSLNPSANPLSKRQ
jgi:hypothetical protein